MDFCRICHIVFSNRHYILDTIEKYVQNKEIARRNENITKFSIIVASHILIIAFGILSNTVLRGHDKKIFAVTAAMVLLVSTVLGYLRFIVNKLKGNQNARVSIDALSSTKSSVNVL